MSYAEDCAAHVRKMRRHNAVICAFANSIGTEFGWSSSIGRIAGHPRVLNTSLCFDLEDAWLLDPGAVCVPEGETTPCAQRMKASEHCRDGARCRPMPAASREAVLSFLDERVALFSQAEAMLRAGRSPRRAAYGLKEAAWQLGRLARLRGLLVRAWVPAAP